MMYVVCMMASCRIRKKSTVDCENFRISLPALSQFQLKMTVQISVESHNVKRQYKITNSDNAVRLIHI